MDFDDKIARISGIVLLCAGIGYIVFIIIGFVLLGALQGQVYYSVGLNCGGELPMTGYYGVFEILFLIPAAVLLVTAIITIVKKEETFESILPLIFLIGTIVASIIFIFTWQFGVNSVDSQVSGYYTTANCSGESFSLPEYFVIQIISTVPYVFVVLPAPFFVIFLLGLLQDRGIIEGDLQRT